MLRVSILFLFCAFFCAGCFRVSDAARPDDLVPKTAYTQWIPPETRKPPELEYDDLSWLMNKAPLTLGEIIDIALTQSPKTRESWAEARSAAANYGQSLHKFFPLVDGYGSWGKEIYPDYNFSFSKRQLLLTESATAQAQVNYLILDFGQRRATSQAALEAFYSADFSHNWNIQSTIQTVMDDYYNFLYTKELVRASKQDIVNAETSLDAVLEKFRNGVADVSDKVQATTSLLQQKLTLVKREQEETNAYTKLATDMGIPANNFYADVAGYPAEIRLFETQTLDCFVKKALDGRPDLQAAAAKFRSKEQLLLAAERERYPKIDGSFDGGRSYFNYGIGPYNYYKFQFELKMPIFQGFNIANEIKKARADMEEAKARMRVVRDQAIREITNYWNDVQYAKESLQFADEYLRSSEQQYQVELLRYKVGTGTIVELINAQTEVSNARAQLILTIRNWYSSLANLAYASGSLTSKFEDASLEKPGSRGHSRSGYTDRSSQCRRDREDPESSANRPHSQEDGSHKSGETCGERLSSQFPPLLPAFSPSPKQSDDRAVFLSWKEIKGALSHPETAANSGRQPPKPFAQ